MKHITYKENNLKTSRGFTLVEIMVSMFISTLIIVTVVAAFASAFRSQKKAREVQRNIEDAKASLEYMAKIIRMSNNLTSNDSSAISMYNKSMSQCVKFQLSSNKIEELTCLPLDPDDSCKNGDIGAANNDCNGNVTSIAITGTLSSASFYIPAYTGAPNPIKRVTIRMQMKDDENAKLQTTVSLRDYKNLNPME
jgi:Tfp pilus assembly protein PilW